MPLATSYGRESEKRKKGINANLCRFNECDRSVYDNENLLSQQHTKNRVLHLHLHALELSLIKEPLLNVIKRGISSYPNAKGKSISKN